MNMNNIIVKRKISFTPFFILPCCIVGLIGFGVSESSSSKVVEEGPPIHTGASAR